MWPVFEEEYDRMNEVKVNEAEILASDHWRYLQSVLVAHGVAERDQDLCGHHYRTAFVHGYKHGVEGMQNEQGRKKRPKCQIENG